MKTNLHFNHAIQGMCQTIAVSQFCVPENAQFRGANPPTSNQPPGKFCDIV